MCAVGVVTGFQAMCVCCTVYEAAAEQVLLHLSEFGSLSSRIVLVGVCASVLVDHTWVREGLSVFAPFFFFLSLSCLAASAGIAADCTSPSAECFGCQAFPGRWFFL